MTAYDEFHYVGHVFPQTHPNRLAVIAALHGIDAAPPERCRVLEVGCGDGTNLLSMAFNAPDSTFVGIDLAAQPLERGRSIAGEIGLTNLELIAGDLMEYQPDAPFDYIIAHGFLSWVPEFVRLRLFGLCRSALAPNGVAFISYNAYPGFHVRRMMGEMLKYHLHGATDPRQKIERSRGLLRLLTASQTSGDEYAALLRHEADWVLSRRNEAVLIHDDLAEINQPYYIREFVALAEQSGLQFLAEAVLHEMNANSQPPAVRDAILGLPNIILREQYLDFIKCRRFRQTLLVHQERPIDRDWKPEVVRRCFIASSIEPDSEQVDLAPGVIESYHGPLGAAMQCDHALTKAALVVLRSTWSRPIPFAELVSAARQLLGESVEVTDEDEDVLAQVLLQMYSNGSSELHAHRPETATEVGERPVASPLMRALLRRGETNVPTLRPSSLLMEVPFFREMLLLLDGTRTLDEVEAMLRPRVATGDLILPDKSDSERTRAFIDEAMRRSIRDGVLWK